MLSTAQGIKKAEDLVKFKYEAIEQTFQGNGIVVREVIGTSLIEQIPTLLLEQPRLEHPRLEQPSHTTSNLSSALQHSERKRRATGHDGAKPIPRKPWNGLTET
jgi:hypothetical protein